MKERPIIFSAPMVNAILDGRKTQTRRVIKPQPPEHYRFPEFRNGRITWSDTAPGNFPMWSRHHICPYGQTGDRLWVRETWAPIGENLRDEPAVLYAADGAKLINADMKWKPSIHMPRWASRILLEITGFRVERVQEITHEDAISEGLKALSKDGQRTIKYGIPDRDGWPGNDDHGWHWSDWSTDPRDAYRRLWESLNGLGSWAQNPWVWCIEFKRIEPCSPSSKPPSA